METDLSKNQQHQQIFDQWQRFQNGSSVDRSIIQEWILASWERSMSSTISPYTGSVEKVSDQELQSLLDTNKELIECAKGIVRELMKTIEDTHSVISLADCNGVILHTDSRSEGQTLFPSHSLGHVVSEKVLGTNAIGTCIYERRPIQMTGAEHYCKEDHVWYCAAAPLFQPKETLVGVLNISLDKEYFHRHTSGMVEAAAYAITKQLAILEILRNQTITMELLDEGVISLDRFGTIASISSKAFTMLHLDGEWIGKNFLEIVANKKPFMTVLDDNTNFYDQEIALEHRPQTSCIFSAVSNLHGGAILTIREYKRMRALTARVIGAKAEYFFENILGESAEFQHAVEQGKIAARSDISTLILGKSGTGKELFAQAIHNASSRSKEPFVVVNCGAIPRDLVPSELFGYSDGAFTGARRGGKPGKFELADGGTIFLDEIGEMPLDSQVSLLRLLQNKEVSRIGSKTSRCVNVRIIAATNKDLLEAMQQKVFRTDLFYRLNAFTLHLPTLRERRDDIALLANHFLEKFAVSLKKNIIGFLPKTLSMLNEYSWPGNIRELEHTIERAVNISEIDYIQPIDLPDCIIREIPYAPLTIQCAGYLKDQEFKAICTALKEAKGIMRQAAINLGISRSTLYVKLQKYNITLSDYR